MVWVGVENIMLGLCYPNATLIICFCYGGQSIKSEDTALVGHVLFDKLEGEAEVDVVEAGQSYLQELRDAGILNLPDGVSYRFSGTYENQVRAEQRMKRIRPCLMTSATTLLALLPALTSQGKGSDVTVPMAIPVLGGMLAVTATVFVVPTLYCAVEELRSRRMAGARAA